MTLHVGSKDATNFKIIKIKVYPGIIPQMKGKEREAEGPFTHQLIFQCHKLPDKMSLDLQIKTWKNIFDLAAYMLNRIYYTYITANLSDSTEQTIVL